MPVEALTESMKRRANPMLARYQQTLRRYNQDASGVCAGCGAAIGIGFSATTRGGLDFCNPLCTEKFAR